MLFCLLGICTTHVASVSFIYLQFDIPCLEEKGKKPIYLVLFTNMGRVVMITGC